MRTGLRLLLVVALYTIVLMGGWISLSLAQEGKGGEFTGSFSASGTRDILSMGGTQMASLFTLAGHVNLKDNIGGQADYWSQCIGLADSETGSDVRCVWRSPDGEEIYLSLKATQLAEGTHVTGQINGGTGSMKGITGSLEFDWSSMSFDSTNRINSIGGYSKNLKGSYQLP